MWMKHHQRWHVYKYKISPIWLFVAPNCNEYRVMPSGWPVCIYCIFFYSNIAGLHVNVWWKCWEHNCNAAVSLETVCICAVWLTIDASALFSIWACCSVDTVRVRPASAFIHSAPTARCQTVCRFNPGAAWDLHQLWPKFSGQFLQSHYLTPGMQTGWPFMSTELMNSSIWLSAL